MRHRRRRRYRARRAIRNAENRLAADGRFFSCVRRGWDDVSPEQRRFNMLCHAAHIQMRECK